MGQQPQSEAPTNPWTCPFISSYKVGLLLLGVPILMAVFPGQGWVCNRSQEMSEQMTEGEEGRNSLGPVLWTPRSEFF